METLIDAVHTLVGTQEDTVFSKHHMLVFNSSPQRHSNVVNAIKCREECKGQGVRETKTSAKQAHDPKQETQLLNLPISAGHGKVLTVCSKKTGVF